MEKRSIIEYQELKVVNDNLFMVVIKFIDGGWRCGYIGVPESSPLYTMCSETLDGDVDIHGGITFHGFLDQDDDAWWYFGFDCVHFRDGKDIRTAKLYFPENKQTYDEIDKIRYDCPEAHVWSLDDVKNELNKFIEQLVDLLEDDDKMKMLIEKDSMVKEILDDIYYDTLEATEDE